MFKSLKKYFAACAVTVLFAAGCTGTKHEADTAAVITPKMKQNSVKLAGVMRQLPVRGVVLPANGVQYYGTSAAGVLADRLSALGINRLYLEVKRTGFLENFDYGSLENICRAAGAKEIACEAVFFQQDYMPPRSGTVLNRNFKEEKVMLTALKKFVAHNNETKVDSRFSGVVIVPQIHTFTLASKELPNNAMYLWSDKSYGKGRDNDLLMRKSLLELQEYRKYIKENAAGKPGLALTVAVPAFFHDRAVRGDLTCGTITDFLQLSDRVIVIGEGSKPSEFGASFNGELKAAAKYKNRVIMGLNLAAHTVGTKNNLRRRDWADFVKITNYLVMRGGKYDAFGGMVFMPWYTLELLWEE